MRGGSERKNDGRTPEIGAEVDSTGADSEFKVQDRRHWAGAEEEPEVSEASASEERKPTVIDEFRRRAEQAEQQLQDYIDAFKEFREEQDAVRQRLTRDVERRVELQFAELIAELLESLDDLDRALAHAAEASESDPIVRGVLLVRERFLSALRRRGVEEIVTDGTSFDPNVAEAVRMDQVEDPELNGAVTETLRVGYKLGERVVRPARVAVGRHVG